MLYNPKYFEIFYASTLQGLNNESEEAPPFWTVFHKISPFEV